MFAFQIKMEMLSSHSQIFLLLRYQHVSAQTGHHQLMGEKYTNDERIL
jgi:hypothetical protein